MRPDRRRLEAMPREDLEREARRVGVTDPENLEREEIVREVLARAPKEPRSFFDRARGFVEHAVGVAKTLIEEARASQAPRPGSDSGTGSGTATGSGSGTGTGTGSGPGSGSGSGSGSGAAPADEPTQEPAFATATLARVYEAQGHVDQALDMYEAVLAKHPADESAREGAARLRPRPAPSLERRRPNGGALSLSAIDPTTLHATWEIDETGAARAAALVGEGGRVVLRVFGSHRDGGAVSTSAREEIVEARRGEWFVRGVRAGGVYHAAVGLERAGKFVPVVRAGPARTPAGATAPGSSGRPRAARPRAPSSRMG